jgi:heme A synthase
VLTTLTITRGKKSIFIGILLTISAVVLTICTTTAQEKPKQTQKIFSSPIRLFDGYRVEATTGGVEATTDAKFYKDGGPTINCHLGWYYGDRAALAKKSEIEWAFEQVINGKQMSFVLTKTHTLVVSVSHGLAVNFEAGVKNDQEVAEALLMIVTYSQDGYEIDQSRVKLVEWNYSK